MKRLYLLLSFVALLGSLLFGGHGPMLHRAAIAQNIADEDMSRIVATLQQYNFEVNFSRPPHPKAYGLMKPATKQVWVHPITKELGIAKPTLIHEAVHAAQSCRSQNPVMPLGIDVPISPLARRHFLRYHNFRRHVEAEALTVQGLPNGADYVIELLHQNCVG